MSTGADIGQRHLFDPPARTQLTLQDRFLVPPFSVLDARAGYWRARKQEWLNIGLRGELGRADKLLYAAEQVTAPNLNYYRDKTKAEGRLGEAGRGDRLLSKATPRAGYGGDYDTANGENAWGGSGTSVFDPVLCELLYRWFTPPGGVVLDPFAGGSVRGICAGVLDRDYLGIDLRPEQCAANREQLEQVRPLLQRLPVWLEGDSRHIAGLAGGARYDFLFSCPPYYDLEQYSDDPRDLSNASEYTSFREAYYRIIKAAAELLLPDRYACFVVGEVRGADGAYIGLVTDTIVAFEEAGLRLYNEAILVTAVGSLPIRVSSAFGKGRKLGKTHQNVLVFVKGDGRRASAACGPVGEVALEQGGTTTPIDEGGSSNGLTLHDDIPFN